VEGLHIARPEPADQRSFARKAPRSAVDRRGRVEAIV